MERRYCSLINVAKYVLQHASFTREHFFFAAKLMILTLDNFKQRKPDVYLLH